MLICEKTTNCYLLEVHRIPYDFDQPEVYRGRLNEEFLHLDLNEVKNQGQSIVCAHLHEGTVAYIATEKGLIRWQFLLQWKQDDGTWTETYDTIEIRGDSQLKCVMSETDAIFYQPSKSEFTIVNYHSFQIT